MTPQQLFEFITLTAFNVVIVVLAIFNREKE
jgi:hypothetical protein